MTKPNALTQTRLSGLVFLAGLSLVTWIYHHAWSGTLFFDDEVNLQALAQVFSTGLLDPSAAVSFILGGNAGPLGRPLALMSFLLDGSAWGSSADAFLYTNTLLHLLNGVLLCAVVLQLGRTQVWPETKTAWIAVLTSLFWLLLPLLASSSLIIVQRMTILSSTFMLAGMWFYLIGRARLSTRPWSAFFLMSLGIGGGTLLGVLTKEQAALLPVLILTLEATLLPTLSLSTSNTRILWLLFRPVALGLPALAIAFYLLHATLQGDANYALRDFNLIERLWTQAVILWQYLFLTFLPRSHAFTPYHDAQAIYGLSTLPVLAASAWVILLGLALKYRRRWALFSLALLWFMAAHSLESSVIPLELYFEHRNYLAVIGALFAMIVFLWNQAESKHIMPVFALGFSIYLSLQAFVLWQVTTLYGEPRLAAEIWYNDNPQSIRAAQFLAQRYSIEDDPLSTLKILDDSVKRIDDNPILGLQALQLTCVVNNEAPEKIQQRLDRINDKLQTSTISFAALPTLQKIKTLRSENKCSDIMTDEALIKISQKLLANPKTQAHSNTISGLHTFLASIYADQLDFNSTMLHLEAALDAQSTFENLKLALAFFNSAGLYQEGLNLLETHQLPKPLNPILRLRQHEKLDILMQHQKTLVEQHVSSAS